MTSASGMASRSGAHLPRRVIVIPGQARRHACGPRAHPGNIEIGENAVVAAGSVVRQSIPANMVAAGVPAKVIKPVSASYAAITAPSAQ